MKVRGLRISFLCLAGCLGMSSFAAAQETIAIKAGRLIDGSGKPAIQNAVILVKGDRIQAVGAASTVQIPAGAKTIDLSSETVMPGLINGHDHPTVRAYTGAEVNRVGRNSLVQQLNEMAEAPSLQIARGVRDLRVDLLSGVTTEYVVGEVEHNDLYLKQMCDAGVIPCPRLYASGPWIIPTAGYSPIPATNGPWAMREMVRNNVEAGAQHIKIVMVVAMATGPSAGRPYGEGSSNFTNEELDALVDEAHRLGVKVTAHASDVVTIKQALEHGVDSIQHASKLNPELIDLFIRKHAGIINTYAAGMQTHFTPKDFHYLDTEANSPEEWIGHAQKIINQVVSENALVGSQTVQDRLKDRYAQLRMARDRQVPFGVGTDNMQGLLDLDIENLVNAGFTPLQALSAATGGGAKVLGIDGDVGTLEKGKLADIISVRGNPDENIHDLTKVNFIMVGGSIYTGLSFR